MSDILKPEDLFDFDAYGRRINDMIKLNAQFEKSAAVMATHIINAQKPLLKQLEDIIGKIEKVNVSQNNNIETLAKLEKESQAYTTTLEKQKKLLGLLDDSYRGSVKSVSALEESLAKLKSEYGKLDSKQEDFNRQQEAVKDKSRELKASIDAQSSSLKAASTVVERVEGSYARLSRDTEELRKKLNAIPDAFDNIAGASGRANHGVDALHRTIQQNDRALRNFDNSLGENQRNLESHSESVMDLVKAGFFGDGLGASMLDWVLTGVQKLGETVVEFEKLDNSLKNATRSTEEFNLAQSLIESTADKNGQDIQALTKSYSGLLTASKDTRLEGVETQKIFSSLSGASAALQFSNEELENAFAAVQQMMSNGGIEAEQLRTQLGENLYGAFNTAAKSIGLTTEKLGEMLKEGTVVSTDLLPRFAKELDNLYGDKAKNNVDTITGSSTRFFNAFKSGILDINDSLGISSKVAGVFNFLADNFKEIIGVLKTAIGTWVAYEVVTHASAVTSTAWNAIQKVGVIIKGEAILAAEAYTGITIAETEAQIAATTAARTFNTTLASNPIGLIALAIGALITAYQLFYDEASKVNELTIDGIKANDTEIKGLYSKKTAIDASVNSLKGLKEGSKEYQIALSQLINQYPDYFGKLDKEKSKYEDIAYARKIANKEIQREIELKARQKLSEKLLDKATDAQMKLLDLSKGTLQGVNVFDEKQLSNAYKDYINTKSGLAPDFSQKGRDFAEATGLLSEYMKNKDEAEKLMIENSKKNNSEYRRALRDIYDNILLNTKEKEEKIYQLRVQYNLATEKEIKAHEQKIKDKSKKDGGNELTGLEEMEDELSKLNKILSDQVALKHLGKKIDDASINATVEKIKNYEKLIRKIKEELALLTEIKEKEEEEVPFKPDTKAYVPSLPDNFDANIRGALQKSEGLNAITPDNKNDVQAGAIVTTAFNSMRDTTDLNKINAIEAKAIESLEELKLKAATKGQKDRLALLEKEFKEKSKFYKEDVKENEEKEKKKKLLLEKSIELGKQLAAASFEFISMRNKAEIEELEGKKKHELELVGNNADAKAAIEKKYNAEILEIKRKQARVEKAQAAFNIGISTAQAIMKFLSDPGGVPGVVLSVAAGITGAIQLATVLAKPLPQFFKGTDNAPEGLAMVAERGPELRETKGRMLYYDKPQVTWLHQGDKIHTAEQTSRILAQNQVNQELANHASQTRLLELRYVNQFNASPIDTRPIEKAIETSFGRMPIHVTQIDQNGFSEYTKSQNARTDYNRKRFSLPG